MRRQLLLFLGSVIGFHVTGQNFENIAPAQGIYHSVNTDLLYGGNGVDFFDFNNDGWDDLTFIQENDSIVFYKNNNGNFEQIPSFVYSPGQTRQVLWVDYDNDSDNDLFITATSGLARLLQNDGSFNFTDVSVSAGLSLFNTNNFGVSFADYDRDGNLDFYLARYYLSGSASDPNQTNALFRNNGDGTFSNVTISAGVGNGIQPSFMGAWIDIDNNSWPDLYVINDRSMWGNTLYINRGDGTFMDYTTQSGAEMFGEDPMGVTFEDYDNDSDIDILCTNGGPPTKPIRLYKNFGDSTFMNVATSLGIHVNVTNHCTWGATWFDVENDSYKDLYVTTGLLTSDATNEIRSYLFRSSSGNSFNDSPGLFNTNHVAASYSCAKGDINNDGFADIVVQNAKNFNSFLWKNNFSNTSTNNFIKITLEGVISNKMAIGSWIKVHCANDTYAHYTRAGEGFVSQNSQHYIFGIGNHQKADSITILYPSGTKDTYYNVYGNSSYLYTEGETLSNEINYTGALNFCLGDSIILDGGNFESHAWNNGYTGRYLTVLQSGSYFVHTETEAGFIIQSDTVVVDVLDQPQITFSSQHNTCANENDGSIQLFVSTMAQSPQITWSTGNTGLLIDQLPAGFYTYTYSDEYGCAANGQIEILEPNEIIVFHQSSWNSSTQSYTIDFVVFGGTGPYSIEYNGNTIGNQINGLQDGTHDFLVSDQEGCDTLISIVLGLNSTSVKHLSNYTIYPNPSTNGEFYLKSENQMEFIELFNTAGKSVPFVVDNDQIKIKEPKSGVYYLKVRVFDQWQYLKLVVS